MLSFLTRYTDQTYALLRIVAGFLFIFHGSQKLFGIPGTLPEGVPTFVIYVAGPIELVGGALIMIGLFTRQAAFLSSGLMAAAFFIAHATSGLLPILNGGELAIMFCFAYLYIACAGSGIWSVDQMRADLSASNTSSIDTAEVKQTEDDTS